MFRGSLIIAIFWTDKFYFLLSYAFRLKVYDNILFDLETRREEEIVGYNFLRKMFVISVFNI